MKISDNELIIEALRWYSSKRHAFANAIAQKSYRKSDGSEPTKQEVSDALDYAKRCDEVLGKLTA